MLYCTKSSGRTAHDTGVVILQMDDVRASGSLGRGKGYLADGCARRDRVHEVRAAAVRKRELLPQYVTMREHREAGGPDFVQPKSSSWQGNSGGVSPGRQLGADCVDVKPAVRREVAVTYEQDVANAVRRSARSRARRRVRASGRVAADEVRVAP